MLRWFLAEPFVGSCQCVLVGYRRFPVHRLGASAVLARHDVAPSAVSPQRLAYHLDRHWCTAWFGWEQQPLGCGGTGAGIPLACAGYVFCLVGLVASVVEQEKTIHPNCRSTWYVAGAGFICRNEFVWYRVNLP